LGGSQECTRQPNTNQHVGSIIGVAIGGALCILILIVIIAVLLRRNKSFRNTSESKMDKDYQNMESLPSGRPEQSIEYDEIEMEPSLDIGQISDRQATVEPEYVNTGSKASEQMHEINGQTSTYLDQAETIQDGVQVDNADNHVYEQLK
ncbi:unnamed protein product, partial [Owenia fusiformis]